MKPRELEKEAMDMQIAGRDVRGYLVGISLYPLRSVPPAGLRSPSRHRSVLLLLLQLCLKSDGRSKHQ